MTAGARNPNSGTGWGGRIVELVVDLCRRIGLVVGVAVVTAACGSTAPTPVTAGASATTITTSLTAPPGGSATTGTASAPPASTINPGPTTAAPTTTVAPVTTTAPPAPLPLDSPGVRGQITAGPTCPVQRADQPCPPNPVAGRVDALDSTGHTANSAKADSTGRYAMSLPPGGYTLRVVTDGPFPRCPDTPATVTQGPPSTVDIACDTGIR